MRTIFWFRSDLRLEDNIGLYYALSESTEVIPVFILTNKFLNSPETGSSRVSFLFDSLNDLNSSLNKLNSKLIIRVGKPEDELVNLARETNAKGIYFNKSYKLDEIATEKNIIGSFAKLGYRVKTFKDGSIFEEKNITVNTRKGIISFPKFKKKWLAKLTENDYKQVNLTEKDKAKFIDNDWEIYSLNNLTLSDFGFEPILPFMKGGESKIKGIFDLLVRKSEPIEHKFKFIDEISILMPYIKFGNISIRKCIQEIIKKNDNYQDSIMLEKIIKIDYYHQFSNIADLLEDPNADLEINWEDSNIFLLLCNSSTGIPIIDAGMKQLNMVSAMNSELKALVFKFVINNLQISEKWIIRYFSHKIVEGDELYFKMEFEELKNNLQKFKVIKESKAFDPQGNFIKLFLEELKNIPELFVHEPYKMPVSLQKKLDCVIGKDYPYPIVKNDLFEPDHIKLYKPKDF